jgi:hypothetical protein
MLASVSADQPAMRELFLGAIDALPRRGSEEAGVTGS